MALRNLSMDLAELMWRPLNSEERRAMRLVAAVRRRLEASTELIADPEGRMRRLGQQAVIVSVPAPKSQLLYRLVRAARPMKVLEFGSAFGVSGMTIGAALEANQHGELVTFELSPVRSRIAGETIAQVTKRATAVCASYMDQLELLSDADLLFFDGFKDEDACRKVLAAALDQMKAPAVVVVDDVSSWPEVTAAWGDAADDHRFTAAGSQGDVGVGLIGDVDLGVRGTAPWLWPLVQKANRVRPRELLRRRRMAHAQADRDRA